jgi:PAS domain S-box-containing protein
MSRSRVEEQYIALTREIDALGTKLAASEASTQLAEVKRQINVLYGQITADEAAAAPKPLASSNTEQHGEQSMFARLVDLPEHFGVEEMLRGDLRILETVVENVAAAIYAKRKDGRYIYVNPDWEELCVQNRKEVIGKTDFDVAPKAIAQVWRDNDLKVMATGKPLVAEESAQTASGERIVRSKKVPLISTLGEIIGICGISIDITDLRRVETAGTHGRSSSGA